MMKITRRNREQIEIEFLSLVIHKCDVLDNTIIKPKYLFAEENKKMFSYLCECYKKHKVISPAIITSEHNDFNNEYYAEIERNILWYNNAWKEQLKLSEESIIKFYKEDILLKLDNQLKNGEITYDEFISMTKKLDKIKITEKENSVLNIENIETKEEESEYVKSKIEMLDKKIIGFALGQLSVWSGGNASAKSTFLNQIAIESINQNYKTLIYSGELVANRLLKWIVMQCSGKRNMKYNKERDYYYIEEETKKQIRKWLNKKLFIYNNNYGNKASVIINSLKQCIKENDIKVLIIDNLMSMNLNEYSDNKYDMQSQLIQELSNLAKELNIHIHFVCHPRKAMSFLRKNDISGSADLTNIADNVFIMHRVNNDFRTRTKEMYNWSDTNEIYNYTNIIEVCKNRDFGVEDYFVGMYFEPESKRLLNTKEENKIYKWEMEW